jgi:succinate-semialdehyde dehydrogenase/glutarate-semialdehyde dehydrogenase
MPITPVNPATGEPLQSYPEHTPREARELLDRAGRAWESWRRTAFDERAGILRAAANVLREQTRPLAEQMAREMGKPVTGGRSELEKCAWVCEHYADHAERMLAPEPVATDAAKSYVAFEPLGVILAVMPWNFPFWQVFRAAAPALMAGNGMVLKHAANVPGCALAIEAIFQAAGLPEDLFRTVLVDNAQVDAILEHPAIAAATLTGSTGAGRAVASKAGALIKKTVLELGGSDPYVILEDADIDKTAESCAASRMVNGGQSCIAAKRFIVVEPVRARFEAQLVEHMRKPVMGDPLKEHVTLGPLARKDLRDSLHVQVTKSIERGAKLLLGGVVPEGPGAFYPPTVLADVRRGMPAYDEETFGPVAAIIGVATEAQAIEAANDSPFGLGAAVFTQDRARGERIAAKELQSGTCFVNAFVRSDPRLPFGGIKQSGYGRELAAFGIREFVNIKTVYIA